jgi:hypothetical protein
MHVENHFPLSIKHAGPAESNNQWENKFEFRFYVFYNSYAAVAAPGRRQTGKPPAAGRLPVLLELP